MEGFVVCIIIAPKYGIVKGRRDKNISIYLVNEFVLTVFFLKNAVFVIANNILTKYIDIFLVVWYNSL